MTYYNSFSYIFIRSPFFSNSMFYFIEPLQGRTLYSAWKMQCSPEEGYLRILFYLQVLNAIDMFITPTIHEFVSATAARLWRLQELTDPPATQNCRRNCRINKVIPQDLFFATGVELASIVSDLYGFV
jgi:hypothetical protein